MTAPPSDPGDRGARPDSGGWGPVPDARERAALDELSAYTLQLGDPGFVHQHVVDAWAAQTAREDGRPIGITFALVGLYLFIEQGLTGRQVQRAHMLMARRERSWPAFTLPMDRGSIRVTDVVAHPPGAGRDRAIAAWARSVWAAYAASHEAVAEHARRWLSPDE